MRSEARSYADGDARSRTIDGAVLQAVHSGASRLAVALLMQPGVAVEALSALAHASRLAVFRLLVRAGADGMAAGDIARDVGALPNTLSTHLTILGHAGLIQSRRAGRSVIYSADYDGMRDLLAFLVGDCCAGRPEICGSLTELAIKAECCA